MNYPNSIDLNDAVQTPEHAFRDAELKRGSINKTPLGLPLALSGGFALTYTLQSGTKKYAVRCFHREVADIERRYAQISSELKGLSSPYFVSFDFQPDGIRVSGKSYPIVKMDWVEGETLELHLKRVAKDKATIQKLRADFRTLAEFLANKGIAHGDIQNMNVMVSKGGLRLIDYDGMFVPGMRPGNGSEFGHKHFQHPGREARHHGPNMDRFSFIALDVSLAAIHIDPQLHDRFREGGNTIIFRANDFEDPANSEVFAALSRIPAIASDAARFAAICQGPVDAVPSLADFIAGRGEPIRISRLSIKPAPREIKYIGAFAVVDAADYAAALKEVGNRVELVGKVVSVFEGVGKKGKGKGKPYVFINFGIWLGESVKLTIWSEGLGNLTARPTQSWEGRWISATGLIDPPYDGKHFGRPYQNVGITVEDQSQIVQLSEDEALFRLGRRKQQIQSGLAPGSDQVISLPENRTRNQDRMRNSPRTNAGSNAIGNTPTPNQKLVEALRAGTQGGVISGSSGPSTAPTPPSPQPARSPSQSSPSSGHVSDIPWWLWPILIFIGVLLLAAAR